MNVTSSSVLSITVFLSCAMFWMTPSRAMAQQEVAQRIVFLGDSITQAGDRPGGYVALVREEIGSDKVQVIGAGISGNRVPDLQKRLQKDVLDKDPTMVVIYIGINDVWHSRSGRGTSAEDFESGLRELVAKIKNKGARVILCTATVIGEKTDGSNSLDQMLDQYCAISRKVASDTGVTLLDLRKAFVEHLKTHNPENRSKGILTTDEVHLNAAGNRFLAEQMLTVVKPGTTDSSGAGAADRLFRHVVLFRFVDGLAEEEVNKIVDAFAELPARIDGIVDFEHGTDVSEQNKSKGFTHVFVVTFRDKAGVNAYLPHPAHQEFVGLLSGKVDDVLVVDYWADAR